MPGGQSHIDQDTMIRPGAHSCPFSHCLRLQQLTAVILVTLLSRTNPCRAVSLIDVRSHSQMAVG
jgi:hypothetical protein